MKLYVTHSIIRDMSVVKFFSLDDYRRCIAFLHKEKQEWIPLKYSSKNNTASIRVGEVELNCIINKFGDKQNASTNTNSGTTGLREDDVG